MDNFIEEPIQTVDGGTIIKRYKKLTQLGSGSFSSCWKVCPEGTDKLYAMKIISKKSMESLEQEKLVNEIQIHQSLSHPHIVFLQHSFEDSQNKYIFLEYCPNGTLEERARKYEPMPEEEIQQFGIQIVRAIKYLHGKRILHRDLKLSNCFLSLNDEIKIGDFGFACRLTTNDELRRETCGTPNFLSPEVAGGFGHSYPSDVWSLGAILYRMKYGSCPFETASLNETIQRIKTINYTFPKWTSISPQLKDLIKKILVLDYDERLTIDQVQIHPFFAKVAKQQKPLQKSNSLSNFFRRLFSLETKESVHRVDSCKNLMDIKKILKEKTEKPINSCTQMQTTTFNNLPTEIRPQNFKRQMPNITRITQAKTVRMPPKSRPENPLVTQYHPYTLVSLVEVYGDYTVVYLTNGIRQLLKDNQNLIVGAGGCYNRVGQKLQVIPRAAEYIIRDHLKDSGKRPTQQQFLQQIQKKSIVTKWKQVDNRKVFCIGNSLVVSLPSDILYVKSDYCEFLYNRKMEIVLDEGLEKMAKQALSQYTNIRQKPSLSPVGRSTRKFLD